MTVETVGGHLSPTPVAGRGPGDEGPAFDQQPVEVASLADACVRAAATDPRALWPEGVRAAAAWFQGDNDLGLLMWDPETGGGFDGLHADRVNLNQGAESTLAWLMALERIRAIRSVPEGAAPEPVRSGARVATTAARNASGGVPGGGGGATYEETCCARVVPTETREPGSSPGRRARNWRTASARPVGSAATSAR